MALGRMAIPLFPYFSAHHRERFERWIARCGLRLLGIRLTQIGPVVDGPALLVSNHSSYLDIVILQAMMQVSFTPKKEIEGWPLIGPLGTAFGAVYVDRTPSRTKDVATTLLTRLKEGRRICLFPESTTNDGRSMKPFRSSLFALTETWDGEQPLTVQPVSILYESLDGKKLDDASWPKVAWYGEATLLGHLWNMFGHKELVVRVICHEPLQLASGETRKDMSLKAERLIRQTVLGEKTSA
ncbi:MAG: 1-acyl-sn-glycerol-3-phosphate acyltransferase [Rickettsiales bacterium]|nr:1-acyl-sn-glycerol-3-phosphate acyltransferase [Rickettsiales bacterium]